MTEDFEPFEIEELGDNDFTNGVWSERVLVITQDYEIKGYVFMPKIGKRSRVLCKIGWRFIKKRERLLYM